MSEELTEYTVLSPVQHDGCRCEIGDVIKLEEGSAVQDELEDLGAIRKGNHPVVADAIPETAGDGDEMSELRAELAGALATIDMLNSDIEKRDEIITELQARVAKLEAGAESTAESTADDVKPSKAAKKDKK